MKKENITTYNKRLFFSAFSPLFFAINIKDSNFIYDFLINYIKYNKFQLKECIVFLFNIIIFISAIIGIILTYSLIKKLTTKETETKCFYDYKIKKCKIYREYILIYIMTYIIPLIAFDFLSLVDILSFMFLFLCIYFIGSKYNYFFTNIVINFFGRFYIATIESDKGDILEDIILLSDNYQQVTNNEIRLNNPIENLFIKINKKKIIS